MEHVYLKYTSEKDTTIKDILVNKLNISSRLLRKLKLNHRIFCNEKEVWINDLVLANDVVSVDITFEEVNDKIESEKGKLNILYEDTCLLIINKTGNMVVHPTCIHRSGTLANFVKYYLEEKGENITTRFVNRLDRETSGVIVFAKNEYTQECLSRQMKMGEFEKEYIAVVNGYIADDRGAIDLPIKREEGSIMTRTVSPYGENAVTHFEVLDRKNDMSVVKLRLETGRTHQIRVHMKAIGHSIVGDGLYSDIKTDKIDRQALHAKMVRFIHPITGEVIQVEAPIPEDMLSIL